MDFVEAWQASFKQVGGIYDAMTDNLMGDGRIAASC
jgi:hypothetical protein